MKFNDLGDEKRVDAELAKLPKAKGTRGQLRGPKIKSGRGKGKGKGTSVGGAVLAPPTEEAATLAELGVDRKAAALAHKPGQGEAKKS